MSDEVPGTGQSALSPRESLAPRHIDHSTVRLAQVVGGQYVLTSQPHIVSALAQINNSNSTSGSTSSPSGVTRIISISPSSRVNSNSIRPSIANQSIVNALTKNCSNVRLQLFPNDEQTNHITSGNNNSTSPVNRTPVKRTLPPTPEKKETYASKLQRVMNHRNVRSKIVKEKYNEHLLEKYYLENDGNILDLYQFAKRPKSQHLVAYLNERGITSVEQETENTKTNVSVENRLSAPVNSPPTLSHSPPPPVQITQHVAESTPVPVSSQSQPQQESCVVGVPSSTPEVVNSTTKTKSLINYPSVSSQEQIVEKAKQEAYVVQRINDLQREGLWSERKLPKVQEMSRPKAHWDFLLEEMVWLAADFAQERKWKKAAAKKCARMVQKHFQDKAMAAQRAEKAHEQHLRRVAAFCAKEVRNFWNNIEKVVEYKQNTRLEEKRKKALDQHLSFIVDQTEKYSQLLAEGMNKSSSANPAGDVSVASSNAPSRAQSDDEFRPDDQDSTDDEETIAQEEAATTADQEQSQSEEIAALQRESEMDLEDFLKELPKDYLENRDNLMGTSDSGDDASNASDEEEDETSRNKDKKKDDDFSPGTTSDEDDEDTIKEQEEAEGKLNHKEELDDLKAENEMSVEELRKKYANLPPASDDENDFVKSESEAEDTGEQQEREEESEAESDLSSEEEGTSTENDEQETEEIGLKSLLNDSGKSAKSEDDGKSTGDDDLINDAAAIAESIQPKGNTLSSTNVVTPIPFLLKYPLREYQHIGLDWLVTMYERKLNGILADEMGLGKTIQTIALLGHLACEKGNWGPHLIVVPTSVMLNWEMECKKWCPAFKILTYYGTQKERKQKRMGWTKPNAFHVCITSYKLVIQDHQSFRRKKWKYLILDEAQNIKNFKSQRWQLLLNFQTQQRLLLTGTPLQNNLMELWSLMHFLMPHVFQSHREFKEWFSNPVSGMIEGNSEYNESIIKRLHKVLRPFLLRRLKSEVEKQMPKKYEHVIMCRLSKRQRFLYDDYMSRAKTRETLATGNLLSVINVLMQLRKVCNHPNLFEVRPTTSPFQCEGITLHVPSMVYSALEYDVWKHIDLRSVNLNLLLMELYLSAYQCYRTRQTQTPRRLIEEIVDGVVEDTTPPPCPPSKLSLTVHKCATLVPEGQDSKKKLGGSLLTVKQEPTNPVTPKEETTPKITSSPIKIVHPHQQHLGVQVTPNVKLFKTQHQGVALQLVQHQGSVKAIPVVTQTSQLHQSSSSSPSVSAANVSGAVSLSSVLKTSDKITLPQTIAQLVQTSTGKHILLTPTNANVSAANISISGTAVTTSGGQRVTVLSKQPAQVVSGTKGVVKLQLGSVTNAMGYNANISSSSTSTTSENKPNNEDVKEVKKIGSKFIERLYGSQTNSLDVRWKKQKYSIPKRHHPFVGRDMEITDYRKNKIEMIGRINERRCSAVPLYGKDFHDSVKIYKFEKERPWTEGRLHCLNALYGCDRNTDISDCLKEMLYNPERRIEQLKNVFDRFVFYVPSVHAPEPDLRVCHPQPSTYWGQKRDVQVLSRYFSKPATPLHPLASAMVTQFPDPRLIQYDCGKLQTLDVLLRRLKWESHRVLIFTQMTKMLDVLEAFLNFHGHIYLRLDGSTKIDQRQVLMERFNGDPRIFAFILSTRSGGIGVNLTGADTVIFYDSDWNPTMDAQAQDRCHRIGQTRDVHIYRLVSERTIEENILKKANQKRLLGDLAIEGGNFTTAYFKNSTIQDLFNIDTNEESAANRMSEVIECSKERERSTSGTATEEAPGQPDDKNAVGALESALAACEDDQDVAAARTAKAEAVADLAEFDENIPLDDPDNREKPEPEMSKAEIEVENLVKQLTPIEKYAMKFIEETETAWSAEKLAAAEREIEEQKREWEENRLAALKEEEERRARELEEESELLTYSREDASNQVSMKAKKAAPSASRRGGTQALPQRNSRSSSTSYNNNNNSGQNAKNRRSPPLAHPSPSTATTSDASASSSDSEFEVSKRKSTSSTTTTTTRRRGRRKIYVVEDVADSESETVLSETETLVSGNNHIDHNSPRTRSRGTVAINLWTLDVSPILPGVKPIRNSPNVTPLTANKTPSKGSALKSKESNENDSVAKDDHDDDDINDDDGGGDNQRAKSVPKDSKTDKNPKERSKSEGSEKKNVQDVDDVVAEVRKKKMVGRRKRLGMGKIQPLQQSSVKKNTGTVVRRLGRPPKRRKMNRNSAVVVAEKKNKSEDTVENGEIDDVVSKEDEEEENKKDLTETSAKTETPNEDEKLEGKESTGSQLEDDKTEKIEVKLDENKINDQQENNEVSNDSQTEEKTQKEPLSSDDPPVTSQEKPAQNHNTDTDINEIKGNDEEEEEKDDETSSEDSEKVTDKKDDLVCKVVVTDIRFNKELAGNYFDKMTNDIPSPTSEQDEEKSEEDKDEERNVTTPEEKESCLLLDCDNNRTSRGPRATKRPPRTYRETRNNKLKLSNNGGNTLDRWLSNKKSTSAEDEVRLHNPPSSGISGTNNCHEEKTETDGGIEDRLDGGVESRLESEIESRLDGGDVRDSKRCSSDAIAVEAKITAEVAAETEQSDVSSGGVVGGDCENVDDGGRGGSGGTKRTRNASSAGDALVEDLKGKKLVRTN